MKSTAVALSFLGALVIAASAAAADAPAPVANLQDPRILVVPYDPDQVVRVDAAFGFQIMIQFAPGERIENVSIGDGASWQVTPNKAATLLFLKPMDRATQTNMTVVSDRRAYLFDLNARPADGTTAAPYVMRFTYPEEKQPADDAAPPERRNTAYSYTGSRAIVPAVVFDDGRFTYFRWPDAVSVPALFLASPDGGESLVNYSVRDGFQVVEQVAPRFVLRNGKDVTVLINEAWREPAPVAGSPRPASSRRRSALRGLRP
ncbi:TrbG/VirB9 family P-type conjugative transfer protein [Phenylobacterium sp. VNQ135]|uniref:TrbG/VirB9 family P-type conjugative transfer protein n=1 Tax=Phenylobacterium sp. VNQ135 TaxID=3400922 RepID=UPI003C11185A